MDVVLLGCLAGLFYGAVNVTVRLGLMRVPDVEAGGLAAALVALVVAFLAAVAQGVGSSDLDLGELWPLVLVGVVVPGISQVLYVHAVHGAGPSRASVVMATSPLLSALLAVAFLNEAFTVALAIGTILIVLGGIVLSYEGSRPADFKLIGIGMALSVAVLLAARDNVVRSLIGDSDIPAIAQAVALLVGANAILLVYFLIVPGSPKRADRMKAAALPFLPGGVCMGLVYVVLLEALRRGEVTIVAPLNGTNVLWTVLLSALVIRGAEAVGPRLVVAATLVVAGGAVIGAFAAGG